MKKMRFLFPLKEYKNDRDGQLKKGINGTILGMRIVNH